MGGWLRPLLHSMSILWDRIFRHQSSAPLWSSRVSSSSERVSLCPSCNETEKSCFVIQFPKQRKKDIESRVLETRARMNRRY
jgi:hypothetical protein